MIKPFFPVILGTITLIACTPSSKRDANIEKKTENQYTLFKPVAPVDDTQELILPEGFDYNILFSEGDTVETSVGLGLAKANHDLIIYLPINGSAEHGHLYVSHETLTADPITGDGGGATIVEIKKENGKWKTIGIKKNVDFSSVGGTVYNCGGTITPKGTILTGEELFPDSEKKLLDKKFKSLKGMNGLSLTENFGWMVEVDPVSGKAIQKIYNFGRYTHEDAFCTPNGKTIYLTDDHYPAVFFKFECEQPNDYSKGQLYAYKQSTDGNSGEWIALPMDLKSLVNAREVAIRLGATMFVRLEWIKEYDGKLYISETGNDSTDFSLWIKKGGSIPAYLESKKYAEGKYHDPFGGILEFDIKTNRMREFLAGGPIEKDGGHFSSPDGLFIANIRNNPYLIISEDLTGLSQGRVSATAEKNGWIINEIYFLDLTLKNPTRNDLLRFAVAPRGCETTGSYFTPDGKTYFVNIQHPDKENPVPFNKSTTIAIQGF
ncbi:MAG: PhoX family protein [Flavobacteriales bacterium]|nr:PhoX family protein [Flavobacteriales bacterium]